MLLFRILVRGFDQTRTVAVASRFLINLRQVEKILDEMYVGIEGHV